MAKRWRVQAFDESRVRDLSQSAGVPSVVAQLLISRGLADPQLARDFLAARLSTLRDPSELPGVPQAVEIIASAIAERQRITVYGDYDADGITGTAILLRCLGILGADVDFYIPNRLDEGYGLHADAVRMLTDRGTRLIITVDCGIASIAEAEVAANLGTTLIITDHHELADPLPQAAAIIHPRLPGTSYPFAGLCGAGVVFKLAWELCKHASRSERVAERFKSFLLSAVGLAAVGTVADVVPLTDENRLLVRHGLMSLKAHPTLGISALASLTKLAQKPTLHSEDIAFTLAPRLNAAGRLGQANLAVELLVTESPERATELAKFLQELNQQRDGLERSILLAANKELQETFDPGRDAAIVLGSSDWHVGVIGIVAGRLAERYQRPCILVAFDRLGSGLGIGSGRTALGINLHRALQACQSHLVKFGGHSAAAGLQIRQRDFSAFRQAFHAHVDDSLPRDVRQAELQIDAEAALPQMTLMTVDQIQMLAPFGQANPRPLLCATHVAIEGPPRCMGDGDRHLALVLSQHSVSLRAVAFGQGDWAGALQQTSGTIDIAYRPVINEFHGRRSVELHLVDWRPTPTLGD